MVSSLTTTFALAASLALFDVSSTSMFMFMSLSLSPLSLANAAVPVNYNPQLMMRNACKDDPEFLFKNKAKKSCAWISNLKKQKKKRRLCNKNKVRRSCPETCQVEDCKDGNPILPGQVNNEDVERVGGGFKTTCPSFPTSMLARGGGQGQGQGSGPSASASATVLTKYVDPSTGTTMVRGEGPWDCSDYVDGLMCFANYHYDTTCGPTGKGSGELICSPRKKYVCNGVTNAWEVSYLQTPECAVQDPREIDANINRGVDPDPDAIARFENIQRLVGYPCSIQECPVEKPKPGSSCSDYTGKYDCYYNFQMNTCGFGFGSEDEQQTSESQCLPIERYKCSDPYAYGSGNGNGDKQDEKTWQLSLMAMPTCPKGTRQSIEKCDPTKCPAKEPVDGSDCTDYQGSDECNYDYKVAGCTPDTQQCSPTKYYTCEEDVLEIESSTSKTSSSSSSTTTIYHTKRWRRNYPLVPACWAEGNGESCDPKGCPVVPPEAGSDCSGYFAENSDSNSNSNSNSNKYGSRCHYNYRYDGCTLDDLQCIPIDLYTCNPLDHKWYLAKRSLSRKNCPPAGDQDTEDNIRNVDDNNDNDNDNDNDNNDNERIAVPPPSPAPPTPQDKDKIFYYDPAYPVQRQSKISEAQKQLAVLYVPEDHDTVRNSGVPPLVIPRGKPCRACPTVLPAVVCPPIAPGGGGGDPCTKFGYPEGLLCSYDFGYEGTDEYQLECVPKTTFKCTESDGWIPRMM